jgi:hypothetical protein
MHDSASRANVDVGTVLAALADLGTPEPEPEQREPLRLKSVASVKMSDGGVQREVAERRRFADELASTA